MDLALAVPAPEPERFPVYVYQGQDVILIGGAVTTPALYARFACSLAHLGPDGIVRCYGRPVGRGADVLIPTGRTITLGQEPEIEDVLGSLVSGEWVRP